MKTTIKSSLKETTTAKGTLAEILGDQGVGAVFQKLRQKFPDIEVPYHKVVGSAGGKADIVLTFGLDYS
jgi:hypothetical protein